MFAYEEMRVRGRETERERERETDRKTDTGRHNLRESER